MIDMGNEKNLPINIRDISPDTNPKIKQNYQYSVVLFDLDGVLTDPKTGITKAVQHALSKLGTHENDLSKLTVFIGPPLRESFIKYYSFDDLTIEKAIKFYRQYFNEKGMFENIVYKGIEDLLITLKKNKIKLIVATSKPTEYAQKILKHFALDKYFDLIIGSNLDGTRESKTEVIEHILNNLNHIPKSEIVMIGDKVHDILGAKNNNIDSIGVTYGYGAEQEIISANPTYLVHTTNQLRDLLLNK